MSFVSRAERAWARGDEARALMVLIEGMKREPGVESAIDLLVRWYSVEQPLLGVEEDVARVVLIQPNPDDLLSALYDNLRVNQNEALAVSLLDHGIRLGLTYIPPPQPAEPEELGESTSVGFLSETSEPHVPVNSLLELPAAPDGVAGVEIELESEAEPEAEPETPSKSPKLHKEPDPLSTPEPQGKRSGRPKGSRSRYAFLMGMLLIAVSLGWWGLNKGKRVSAIRTLDAALETIDPLAGQELLALVERLERTYPDDPEIVERGYFARVELGSLEELPIFEDPSTMWGVGALAITSVELGDVEGGIRYVTHLERGYPGTIPTLWAGVRLAELRGHEREMLEGLSELNRENPEFLPGWIAKLRLDLRRMDREGMRVSKQRIEALVPLHPYARIPEDVFPSAELVAGGVLTIPLPNEEPHEWVDQSDDFLKSVSELHRSIKALYGRDFTTASQAVSRALEAEPKFGPALFVSGLVKIRNYDLDGISTLRLISQIEGASDELVQMTQAFGTVALSSLGRAEDASYFVPVTSDETLTVQEGGFRRIIAASASPYGVVAAYGSEMVSYELGLTKGFREPPLTQDARDRGDWEEVIRLHGTLAEKDVLHAGDVVLAHLALGHMEEAQAELSHPKSILGDLILNGPRLLSAAWRNSSDSVPGEDLLELVELQPEGVTLPTWIADALIWQGDLEKAEAMLAKVVSIQDANARANWLLGIVLRHRGEFRQSEYYFSKARSDMDVNSLIELGDRFSTMLNHDESRKMFHKAIMQERGNLRALRGLGRSYAELESETAVRDLERISQSYEGSEWVAQRAEALKWLGVSLGVRNGNPAGLVPLEDAEKLVGKRADILVEQAKYYESVGEDSSARQLYGQALQSNSTLGDAHLGLGRTALRAKDVRIARDHLRKYLELEPRGRHRSWAKERLSALE